MCRFPKILNTAVSITVFLTAAALSAGCNDDSATNDPVKIVAPAAPTDLTASAVTSSKVALAWQDASSDEGGFYVERKPESGEFGRIAALPSNTTAWTDSGLAPGTFAYRIAAFRDTLVSAWSNEVTVTLKAAEKTAIIADHATADLSLIPSEWIDAAKTKLHIAYGHTSHGSQITTGMQGLAAWKGSKYAFNKNGTNGALDLRDTPFTGAYDLGNPDLTSWEAATRTYLAANPTVNVVMWSWCGQVSGASAANIANYLSLMSGLEKDFPAVKFVYMTGHLDGTGLTGNLHLRNEQIRAYCRANAKILFDFNDIEMYNPDGVYFGDKKPNDACEYTDGTVKGNWATEWQDSHTKGVDWYECESAHSQPLNANRKAYAAWWLWARLAGWE